MVVVDQHYRDDTGLIAHRKNLVVSLHWQQPTLPMAESLRALTDVVVAEHERFASAVVVVGRRLPGPPAPRTRAALIDLVEHTKLTGLATAFVVTAGGFLTGAVVSLLSGMFTVARTREPSMAFRTVEPAADWLDEHLEAHHTPWEAGEVAHTMAAIMDRVPPLSAAR